ncbi:50S ribosomal protein L10, partial [Streptomyces galilaeus]
DNQKLEVKALSIDGKLYGAKDIDLIAKLPNREQALSMLANVMQAPVAKFGRLLTALKEKHEAAA